MMTFVGTMGLVLGSLGGLAADQPLDVLKLKDGRVLQGEIVGETDSKVELMVDGTTRTFSRDFITNITYGGADEGAQPEGTALRPGLHGDALSADLAARYRVPESSVLWARHQGISDSDLPEVFEVAAEAQVPIRPVVDLRLKGMSWREIRDRFGLEAPPPPSSARVVVVAPLVMLPPPLIFRILFFPFFLFRHFR
jgi:hypothetical protein